MSERKPKVEPLPAPEPKPHLSDKSFCPDCGAELFRGYCPYCDLWFYDDDDDFDDDTYD